MVPLELMETNKYDVQKRAGHRDNATTRETALSTSPQKQHVRPSSLIAAKNRRHHRDRRRFLRYLQQLSSWLEKKREKLTKVLEELEEKSWKMKKKV